MVILMTFEEQAVGCVRPEQGHFAAGRFKSLLDFTTPLAQSLATRWDQDRMVAAVLSGEGRVPFLDDIAALSESKQEEWKRIEDEGSIDDLWDSFADDVHGIAQKHFASQPQEKDLQCFADKQEIRDLLVQRASLRHQVPDSLLLPSLDLAIKGITKTIKLRQRTKLLADQVWVAWKARDFHLMWKLSRRLARTGAGPGRCYFGVGVAQKCTREQWLEFLQQPGPDGGLAAEEGQQARAPDQAAWSEGASPFERHRRIIGGRAAVVVVEEVQAPHPLHEQAGPSS